MGTLTALMNLSREALQADQTALNVTSSNVANQNTVGYTRQVVSWQTTDVVTLTGTTEGVAATVASQRDRVLEMRVQQQTQVQAQSGAVAVALGEAGGCSCNRALANAIITDKKTVPAATLAKLEIIVGKYFS